MILDRLENGKRYEKLHPQFTTAFSFLQNAALANLPSGRHPLNGDRLYAVVVRENGRGRDKAVFEAHRKYIDIQFCLSGTDVIGWKPTPLCSPDRKGYDEAGDAELFTDKPDNWVSTPQGYFAIFFPEDAHAPLSGSGPIAKVVVKVPVQY